MNPQIVVLQRRILWTVLSLLLLGHIALFSATAVIGSQRHQSEFYFVFRQAVSTLVGLVVLILISRAPLEQIRRGAIPLLLFQILLMGAALFSPFGHTAQGARRWLHVGSFAFQPSELAKITVVLYIAHLLALSKGKPATPKKWAIRLLPVALLLGFILKTLDLGTTTLLSVVIVGMFFIAGLKVRYLFALISLVSALFTFFLFHSEYRRRRLLAFLNPWGDPQGSGFQTIQSYLSFHSGKFFGTGIGNGNSKLFFLPDVHTDFIYALIGEELGFLGALIILGLFVYFAFLLFKVTTQAKEPFGCFLTFGLALGFILQIVVNMGGVTGLIPMKGLPLPFISWGRSALFVNLVSIGLILNVLRRSGVTPKEKTSK